MCDTSLIHEEYRDTLAHDTRTTPRTRVATRARVQTHALRMRQYGMTYTELIAPLVKAVQELTVKVEDLESRLRGRRESGSREL